MLQYTISPAAAAAWPSHRRRRPPASSPRGAAPRRDGPAGRRAIFSRCVYSTIIMIMIMIMITII